MDNYNKIMIRLKSDFELLESEGKEVLGIFLQGSQNYNLDYEDSDIDTKSIIIPSFEDFLLNKKMVSTTRELPPNNEHLDIKDIRLMFETIRKQNINFVEILFTDYMYINPKYEELFNKILGIKEQIGRYDVFRTLNSVSGMSLEKLKAMEHPYPTLKDKIEKYGFDGKQVSHIERLNHFIKKFVSGDTYKECLIVSKDYRQHMIDVKTNKKYNLEEARIVARNICDETYNISKKYQSENEHIINHEVVEIMNKVMIEIFKIRFKDELK